MVVTLVGLALVLGVALFVAWPMLASDDRARRANRAQEAAVAVEPVALAARGQEKDEALAAIKEADFDHRIGKLSDEDHASIRAALEARALAAITALDEASATGGGTQRARGVRALGGGEELAAFCARCGEPNRQAASFCASCGAKLKRTRESNRKRA